MTATKAKQTKTKSLARTNKSEVYSNHHWPVLTRPRLVGFNLPPDNHQRPHSSLSYLTPVSLIAEKP